MRAASDRMVLARPLLVLQQKLLTAFRGEFPNVHDWQFLLDAPKSGEVLADGELWSFRRHGSGLAFKSNAGVVIDMHRALLDPGLFDAWRLLQYLESIQVSAESLETKLEE